MYAIRFFRIYDIGDEVRLGSLEQDLAASMPTSRSRFHRVSPASITIDEPPILVRLQGAAIRTPTRDLPLTALAKVFDFGAISICLCLEDREAPAAVLEEVALAFAAHEGLSPHFERALSELREVLRPSLGERPIDAEFYEEYTIFHADREDPGIDQVAVLLGEKAGFSQGVREDCLRYTFSYYPDEKAVLSWGASILFSPDPPLDLIELIEYAAVQVLELRFYERELSRQMERMYDDIENAERLWWISRSFHYRALMKGLMSEQAEVSEVIEDVNNLIKVTEDVYYARVYAAALQVLRSGQWTDSVNRKLATIRETYRMLSDEVNIQHAHFLEWIIILLIAFEIVIFLLPVAGH